MRSKAFLLFLVGCSLSSGISCSRRNSAEQRETERSVEVPIRYRKILEWDVPHSPGGQGNGVQGIAVDRQSRVYVADAEGRRILVYESDGKLLREIKPGSHHPKILQRPFALLFDGQDRLYVTDYDADQVQVFNTEGRFLFAWGGEGNGNGRFRAPVAIDQDREGDIYVLEFYGMRVQKFTRGGKFLLTWGTEAPWGKAAPPEQLLYPDGLAIGPDGNVYVTDAGHDRIKVFDTRGRFSREWGTKGVNPGELNAAGGIAFDSSGRLHEADAANHRVQMFTPDGKFLGEWYLPNAGNLHVWSPTSVHPESSQFLYVSDVAENKVFKLAIEPHP